MESLTNIKTHQRLEYKANGKLIRWTEVNTEHVYALSVTCGLFVFGLEKGGGKSIGSLQAK